MVVRYHSSIVVEQCCSNVLIIIFLFKSISAMSSSTIATMLFFGKGGLRYLIVLETLRPDR